MKKIVLTTLLLLTAAPAWSAAENFQKNFYDSCYQGCASNNKVPAVSQSYCSKTCACVIQEMKPVLNLQGSSTELLQQLGSPKFGPKMKEATQTCEARNIYIVKNYLQSHPDILAKLRKQYANQSAPVSH